MILIREINDSNLPEDVVEAFSSLASAQRGRPESAMLKVQHTMGGGVLSYIVEHVGDLIHRMTDLVKFGHDGYNEVSEKIKKTLRVLTNPYGFDREYRENVRNNASYYKKTEEEFQADIDAALKIYTDEHRKLPAYNRPQYMARQASIAVGEKDWGLAVVHLREIEKMLDDREKWKTFSFHFIRNEDGTLKTF